MNHVLIVDDEAEIRESLEGILSEEDYLVTTAATAAEALTLLRDAAYDVVLLDIWLPDRDGLDTLGNDGHAERLAPNDNSCRRLALRSRLKQGLSRKVNRW